MACQSERPPPRHAVHGIFAKESGVGCQRMRRRRDNPAIVCTPMNYPEAIQYLLSFADFERSGRFQDRPDVAPMLALLRRLGDPHLGRVTVHIAGSKGKGSVAAMVDSILRADGLTSGLYTSPHLHSYTE